MSAGNSLSVVMLRSLAESLRRLDLDADGFLAALEITETTAPDTYVSGLVVDRLLDERAAQRPDEPLALALAKASIVRPFGVFGHMLWMSATVRDAFVRATRFYSVLTRRATLELVDLEGGLVALRQRAVPGFEYGRILTEFAVSTCALGARGASGGSFRVRGACFMHQSEAAVVTRYEQVLGAPVFFGAPYTELVFEAAMLEAPLETREQIVAETLEDRVAELSKTSGRSTFVDRVRRAIAEDVAAELTPATVAARLGISMRTLRRRLDAERCSLRALVDDVRRERTEELLRAGLPIKEIAFALGFSEPSALSRAYKRWTGKPPTTRVALVRRTRS